MIASAHARPLAIAVLLLLWWRTHQAHAQGFAVNIVVDCTPPDGFIPTSDTEYRAASGPVVVTCIATGGTGSVSYQWSSTCRDCPFQTSTSATVSREAVTSGDTGTHTCTAVDAGSGNTESASIEFSVVGAGIHIFNGVPTGSMPNHGLVVSADPVSGFRLRILCGSDSMMENVGTILGRRGNIYTGDEAFVIDSSQPGQVTMENVVDSQTALGTNQEGVYTCRIPLQSGEIRDIYLGIYTIDFSTLPSINNPLVFTQGSSSSTLTCTSTGSPATTVTFTRDSDPPLTLMDTEELTDGNVTYRLAQTVINTTESTYQNILTINQPLADIVGSSFTCTIANAIGSSTPSDSLQIMEFEVSIVVDYSPPDGFTRNSDTEYRAASGPVVVTCIATGASGTVSYQWSSTCRDCPFQTSTTATVRREAVTSGDTGTHTCTAVDGGSGNTESASIEFSVVGAGIHVFNGVQTGSMPNHGLVVSADPVSGFRLRILCGSDSMENVGTILGRRGNIYTGDEAFVVDSSQPGQVTMENVVDSQTALETNQEGVYTCRIPLQSGEIRDIYLGIYTTDFSTLPSITNPLEFTPGSSSSNLTCTSTGSPATTVIFRRDTDSPLTLSDGEEITDINGVTYEMSQTVTNATESTYQNVLTIKQPLSDISGSSFTCSVANAIGTSTPSEFLQVMTPGPVSNILWNPQSDSSVIVSWETPLSPNGIILEYIITLVQLDDISGFVDVQTVNGSTFVVTFTSPELEVGVPYILSIVAVNVVGRGERTTVTNFTRELIPSPPSGVTVDRTSGIEMTVSWTPLTLVEARSLIQFYRVFYSPGGSSRKRQSITTCFQSPCDVPGTESSVLIVGLDSLTSYSIRVAVVNGQGEAGEFSETIVAEAPAAISSVNIAAIVGGTVAAATTVLIIAVTVIITLTCWYRSRAHDHGQLRINESVKLNEMSRSEKPLFMSENVAYVLVNPEVVYETIPAVNEPPSIMPPQTACENISNKGQDREKQPVDE